MRLPALNRFQTKLVLLFLSLFILVQIATYVAVYLVTVRNLDREAIRHLSYSGEIFTRAMQERADMLADGAAVLSNDFGFREAVATDDDPTIISALSNLAGRIGADRSFLIGLDRLVRADTGTSAPLVGQSFPMSGLLDHAEQHGRAVAIRELDGQLYDFVVMPVLAPVTIAWVGLGIRLDDAEARAVRDLMPQGMEVAFLDASGSGPQVLASSMPLLAPDIPAVLPRGGGPASLDLAGGEYLARAIDLRNDDGVIGATAFLQYSMDVAFGPYRALIYALLALLAVGMAVLAWSSTLVAGSVSRPLRLLADAAGKASRGDYQPVALMPSRDEIGQLTDSFNRMVTSIEERERTITYQAEHDSETGLPNRRKFEALLNMFIETSPHQSISVVVVTVERVNEVRNTFGFATWERLIGLIGPRLIDSASGAGMIARLSTVSFIIAFPGLDVAAARRAAEDLRNGFEQPFTIDAFTIDSNAQIGIANYPDHASTAEGLVQKASIAVMQGQTGGATVSVYDPERDSHTAERLSLMGDLKKSLAAGEVLFYYQPKIDLKRGVMSHVEALVRWRHPKLGFIPPDEFITLAEQTGHIGHLTAWALESAIRQCGAWHEAGHAIRTAINLSARDLADRTLPFVIARLLKKYAVNPGWIVLEVTESAVMQDPGQAIDVLDELKRMKLTLSIDDYGTGYSSLSYLKKLPIDELKIDRSFVTSLATSAQDQILVRSTIDMGHSLGLKVTAEGVEDEASADLLRAFGCDLAQGYFFSRPIPVEELDRFIQVSPYGKVAAVE